MRKMKKGVALALTATMVLGSTVTAFAADTNSGSTTGEGTSEGHVDKHVINVELPTVAEGSTPFAYTMDAERLVQETDGAKYENAVFPAKDGDTGVYFLTGQNDDGKNVYANTSTALKATSKSSADVKLTVEVTADSKDSDISLVDTAPASDVTDPQLYLALNVGGTTKAIKKGETAKAEVTLAGKDDNFETTVDNEKYVYTEKKVEEGGTPLTWNEESISLTGAVSKASAKDLTAPTLTVTWKYEDPAATPETVAGGIFYDDSTNDWWLGTSDSAGFESGITLGDVTVNGQAIDGTVTDFEGEDWVVIKWSDYVDAGYDQDETEFDFTAVVNGITYTAHYTYGA